MVSKKNFKLLKERDAQRFYRYAIKRLSVGVASVAVSAGLLFVSNGISVHAAEVTDSEVNESFVDTNVTVSEIRGGGTTIRYYSMK